MAGCSCELLSFFSIFGIQNNLDFIREQCETVVNCFHFSVSLGYKTTIEKMEAFLYELWIAFIFQYLWDTKQLLLSGIMHCKRCELLSFFSIFGIQNNAGWLMNWDWVVVNCFHFSVSLGYKTTRNVCRRRKHVLWIAFIFQYLWDTKQHGDGPGSSLDGCELLSFFSIFGIQNNDSGFISQEEYVVNCFHFSVSLGYKTTVIINPLTNVQLWIAFIFQYLWDTKQPAATGLQTVASCELLSFFSIFGIQNNTRYKTCS